MVRVASVVTSIFEPACGICAPVSMCAVWALLSERTTICPVTAMPATDPVTAMSVTFSVRFEWTPTTPAADTLAVFAMPASVFSPIVRTEMPAPSAARPTLAAPARTKASRWSFARTCTSASIEWIVP
jgi:hypothetical protein